MRKYVMAVPGAVPRCLSGDSASAIALSFLSPSGCLQRVHLPNAGWGRDPVGGWSAGHSWLAGR